MKKKLQLVLVSALLLISFGYTNAQLLTITPLDGNPVIAGGTQRYSVSRSSTGLRYYVWRVQRGKFAINGSTQLVTTSPSTVAVEWDSNCVTVEASVLSVRVLVSYPPPAGDVTDGIRDFVAIQPGFLWGVTCNDICTDLLDQLRALKNEMRTALNNCDFVELRNLSNSGLDLQYELYSNGCEVFCVE